MLSVGVSELGRTAFIFVEPGVKMDGAYYGDVLLPNIRHVAGEFFMFKQYGYSGAPGL